MTKAELYDKTVNPRGRWEEPIYDDDNLKVTISHGNSKMGAIPSVSLPPILTCPEGCPCAKKCYAAKMCRIYPSVKRSYEITCTSLKRIEANILSRSKTP